MKFSPRGRYLLEMVDALPPDNDLGDPGNGVITADYSDQTLFPRKARTAGITNSGISV